MKTYYVYMVLCADESFYVGITNDVERRVAQHNLGVDERSYTFKRRPVRLVHSSDFRNVYDAIAWEKQLKGWTRAKKIALIEGRWDSICALAACLNETAAVRVGGSSFDSAQDDKGLRRR